MKKLLLLLLWSPSILYSQDFKTFYWGDSPEKVKSVEKATFLIGNESSILYETEIENLKCDFSYFFENGKLAGARYQFTGKHSNENLYIDDFEKVKNLLIEKYGKPNVDDEIWKNDLFKGKKDDYGLAISQGHLVLFVRWNFDRTHISTTLKGDNGKITHSINYFSQTVEHQEKAKKETLNKL